MSLLKQTGSTAVSCCSPHSEWVTQISGTELMWQRADCLAWALRIASPSVILRGDQLWGRRCGMRKQTSYLKAFLGLAIEVSLTWTIAHLGAPGHTFTGGGTCLAT